jgi:hypothetical protein
MAWTLSRRIISASEMPSSAVDIAPASVTSILPPAGQMRLVTLRRIDQRGRIEMAVVPRDEAGNGPLLGGEGGIEVLGTLGLAFRFHGSSVRHTSAAKPCTIKKPSRPAGNRQRSRGINLSADNRQLTPE